jgi:2-polyprenyl-3-methyl-5-hydroxy-6-metoxy-1,4-benzoquinol methylase
MNRFEQIYDKNEWGHGSGEGSLLEHTRGYMAFLQEFMAKRGVKSVVEMGCGDWQFSKFVDWAGANYSGFDVVPSVIKSNQEAYAKAGVTFQIYSGDPVELPSADLLIVKDVLQHLNDEAVKTLFPQLSRFKFALLTNCINPRGDTVNRDIEDGDFRYLDLRLPPFNLNATEVFSFSNEKTLVQKLLRRTRWHKHVLLVERL